MSPGRWFATGPEMVCPSARSGELSALFAAVERAKYFGVGMAWEITENGAVARRRYVVNRNGEPVTEEWSK